MFKITKDAVFVLLTVALLLSLLVFVPALASTHGSNIEDQVARIENGTVRLTFEAREGVCGDGETFISVDGSRISWSHSGRSWSDDKNWENDCDEGPVRVALKIRDGKVVKIKTRVGGHWRKARGDILDLGDVSPQEAADYMLSLARRGRKSVAEDAIFPATLARDVVIWPDLLEIARKSSRPEDVRKSAVFWLGQIAGDKVTEHLAKLVDDDDENLEVRESAVFALSQRDERKSTRHLMKIARSNPHPQLRKSAMFWLAQRDDPDVLDFFEEVLLED